MIYKFTLIGMIRHTYCLIYIHKSTMIINQTIIKLFDIRYAQNYILDGPCNLQLILPMHIQNTRERHIEHNYEGFDSQNCLVMD